MKSILTLTVLLTSFRVIFAENLPFIQDGRYNIKTKAIEINVHYGGGCAEHKFQLQVGIYLESYPVQCDAKLIDLTTKDFCEPFIHRKVFIDMYEAGLDDDYYKGSSIQSHGIGDSEAFVVLQR